MRSTLKLKGPKFELIADKQNLVNTLLFHSSQHKTFNAMNNTIPTGDTTAIKDNMLLDVDAELFSSSRDSCPELLNN